ncbi:MAG: hypothetical protein ACOVP4_11315 [Bacteriovoracaceae bacterium]
MWKNISFIKDMTLLIAVFFSFYSFAKDRNGDLFKTSHESSFLQREFGSQLNSLQVLANPLFGEPFYSLENFENKMLGPINEENDNFKNLLLVFPDYKVSKDNIHDIQQNQLNQGLSVTPLWSYHAMPTHKGGIAFRHLDRQFQSSNNWQTLFKEYSSHLPDSVIRDNDVDSLSSIEKYEYLIGNTGFNITESQWQEGQKYMNLYGKVPSWIGLCHGTAPASLNTKRPLFAISLKSFDKKHDIKFYPSDIKNLISYAWAKSGGPSEIMGTRCGEVIRPSTRASQRCLDTNPGSFHLAVINLMGIHGQPFIIDSSAGHEVWNRSIKSYNYRFFRPGSRTLMDRLDHAMIAVKDFKSDPHAKYRSPEATHIVGVSMDLTYIVGTKANDRRVDSTSRDETDKTTYLYDVEIDKAGKIIGGEWQDLTHPDFLWVVGRDYNPRLFEDYLIDGQLQTYDGRQALSPTTISYAQTVATRNEVLFTIIEAMIRISQDGDERQTSCTSVAGISGSSTCTGSEVSL